MNERDEPRELTPLQTFVGDERLASTIKDFGPNIIKIDPNERNTPSSPKAESVQEPALSSPVESLTTPGSPTAPTSSGEPVPDAGISPTERLEAAVAASGKSSNPSADVPPIPTTTSPQSGSSSQSSSGETSPGKSTQPAEEKRLPVPPPSPPIPSKTSSSS